MSYDQTFDPNVVCDYWLASCLAELDACGSDPILLSYAGIGVPVWDNCCGQLVVGIENIYRSQTFPAEDSSDERCSGEVVSLVVLATLVRCVPTIDDRGRPPSQQAMADAHAGVLRDQGIMWKAMSAPMPPTWEWERAFVRSATVTPTGGCVAIETRATIGIDAARWCADCP